MELNEISASTSITASVSYVANISCIKCTAASHSVRCPPHIRKLPTVFVTSSFTILLIRSTAPTPIGWKPGLL